MHSLTLLIKPASSRCNLRCAYCFYHETAEHRAEGQRDIMTFDTLETLVRRGLSEVTHTCFFAFQGGEPTLAGLGFFEELIRLQRKHNLHGVQIQNSLQTNGTLLDDRWAQFLADHDFLVGLSLDGYKDLHDLHRKTQDGAGSHTGAERAARLLTRYGVSFNILTVVTDATVRHARKIYRYFRKQGFFYLQFIPCLDSPDARSPGLTPGRYGRFLCDLFDEWYNELSGGTYVSIRLFDNYLQIMQGFPPEACDMNGVCSINPVVESDGSLYPCDFYADDEWYMGSILNERITIQDMIRAGNGERFTSTTPATISKCERCKWLPLCGGGCRRMRESNGDIMQAYRLCEDLKIFFNYAGDRLEKAAMIMRSAHH